MLISITTDRTKVRGDERANVTFATPTNDRDTEVKNTELKSRKASSTSLMPPGIINGMNEDEVRDLLSGGDAKSEVFR
ncbi:MAG: hypothetical protein NTU79_02360 [Planctomycetota bacterium]|nr:hypothetical protein [Planctomycetota bacterium]